MTKQIELDHVGPIEHLTIPIPDGGGVVVLRGANGVGKSHALNGVSALYSKDARKDLRQSDGVPSGSIEGPGISIRLGRSNTVKGELVCQALDGRIDPSQLVDPGIKDPLAADSRRLATLIRLAGVEVSLATWQARIDGLGDDVDMGAFIDDDPVATADRLRRRIHDIALKNERLGESKAGESAAIEKTVADVRIIERTQDELAASLSDAIAALATAEQQRKAGDATIAQSIEFRVLLSEAETTAIDIPANIQAEKEWGTHLEDLAKQIIDTESKLRGLVNEKSMTERSVKDAQAAIAKGAKEQAQFVAWRTAIEKSETVLWPTDETLRLLADYKAKAMEAAQNGEVSRRAVASRAKAATIRLEAETLLESAKQQREIARSMDAVLEQALVDAGFTSIKVHDGRLCVKSDRGLEPFGELSMGERWTLALDLAARGMAAGAVLAVEQEAWESLDPANREFVSSLAKERGLIIVTAEATAGDLRAEIFDTKAGTA